MKMYTVRLHRGLKRDKDRGLVEDIETYDNVWSHTVSGGCLHLLMWGGEQDEMIFSPSHFISAEVINTQSQQGL
jgi:hypothetical protein